MYPPLYHIATSAASSTWYVLRPVVWSVQLAYPSGYVSDKNATTGSDSEVPTKMMESKQDNTSFRCSRMSCLTRPDAWWMRPPRRAGGANGPIHGQNRLKGIHTIPTRIKMNRWIAMSKPLSGYVFRIWAGMFYKTISSSTRISATLIDVRAKFKKNRIYRSWSVQSGTETISEELCRTVKIYEMKLSPKK